MLYKFLGVTMDGDIPVAKFADQASANEYVEFMKQFDPATTDVQEVAH
jgi:hypothetical protein